MALYPKATCKTQLNQDEKSLIYSMMHSKDSETVFIIDDFSHSLLHTTHKNIRNQEESRFIINETEVLTGAR